MHRRGATNYEMLRLVSKTSSHDSQSRAMYNIQVVEFEVSRVYHVGRTYKRERQAPSSWLRQFCIHNS